MKLRHQVILLCSAVILALTPVAARGQFLFEENPLIGKQAPNFQLKSMSGGEMSLNQFRGDGPAMIVFWATWCPSCREELRQLNGLQDAVAKAGAKVVLINLEENPRLVKAFADKLKIPYTILLDERSETAEQYSIIGLPTVFFVDSNGVVVAMEHELPKNFLEMLKVKIAKKS